MNEIKVGKVAMIPMANIKIGERARKEFGNLDDIETSMKEIGLISPLAVRDLGDGTYELLAGERRFTVLRKNGVETVSARIYDQNITELEIKGIELAENFYRKDFEFWEYDNLVREIHTMQQSIHGAKPPGPSNTGWGVTDTGDLVGISKGHVSTAIKRAEARDAFPELFKDCKSQSDATKVMKKVTEAAVKQVIAAKIEKDTDASSTLTQLSKSFIIKDFFEGVKEIPDRLFHMVEIDPPYAIRAMSQKRSDNESQYVKEDYNEIPVEEYQVFLAKLFAECYRVMTDHSWLICWFGPDPWFETVYQELNNTGFKTNRLCGIWTKPSGQSMHPETNLANGYEMFFYARKGSPVLNKMGRLNIFDTPPVPTNKKIHPTERPIDLMREVYSTFAMPGSRILIPFLGSGNGILAAHSVSMSPIGFEKSKAYRDSFLVRLFQDKIV